MSQTLKKMSLISFALLAFLATAASAMPQVSQTESRYVISGNSPDELRAQMDSSGPLLQGQRFNASTEYFVRWNLQYQQNAEGCKVSGSNVMLFINQYLPEWQNYSAATPDAKHVWDVYFDRLKQHESGHVNHGMEAANEVESMFSTLPVMASCSELENTAKEKTDAIVAKYKAVDESYDMATTHGMTQNFA